MDTGRGFKKIRPVSQHVTPTSARHSLQQFSPAVHSDKPCLGRWRATLAMALKHPDTGVPMAQRGHADQSSISTWTGIGRPITCAR